MIFTLRYQAIRPDTFPNNTPSEYTAKLSQRIELNGEWEVALHTISYVKWNTIKLDGESVHYVVSDGRSSTKKTGSQLKDYYADVKEYIADMNASILEADKGKITFTIHSGKVTITLESGYSVHLRKEQAIILGFLTFNDSDIVKKITATETGSYEANLHRETSIHIYCDIIEPQIVGNRTVPLLDIIWDKEKGKREITHSSENLHYVPVRTKSFEEVRGYSYAEHAVSGRGHFGRFRPGYGFWHSRHVVRHAHFTPKLLRLSVLNEVHTNS